MVRSLLTSHQLRDLNGSHTANSRAYQIQSCRNWEGQEEGLLHILISVVIINWRGIVGIRVVETPCRVVREDD